MDRVAAAVRVAASYGVQANDPVVLHDGANLVVHLRPAPVVAKVAAATLRVRPDADLWLGRELALAGHAAAVGVPVVSASGEFPPIVHTVDGVPMTFWEHLTHDPAAVPSPQLVGDLHEGLASYPAHDLPRLAAPLLDLERFLALDPAVLAPAELARLAAAYERLAPQLRAFGPVQALHGDPHPGNLLAGPGGWTWCDFEDGSAGPRVWDLAALAETQRLDGAAAVRVAAPDVDHDQLRVGRELRRLHLTAWYALYADRTPQHRSRAEELLAGWR